MNSGPDWQTTFAERHRLPASYLDDAQQWFAPLASRIAAHRNGAKYGIVVGVNGSQGSGKTTLCDYLCDVLTADHGLRAISLSLDDFYLTRQQRQRLAAEVHPLLATRGVPGTHDGQLLRQTLDALVEGCEPGSFIVPRFDKSRDDRVPAEAGNAVPVPYDIVLLEGWCLGVRAENDQDLARPVNELERSEDADCRWRGYVNDKIRDEFEPLYRHIDRWVMLRAPSFDCVYRWRLEQEHKLSDRLDPGDGNRVMDDVQLGRFIQFFERITRRCLEDLPLRVHDLYQMDAERRVMSEAHCEHPGT